MTPGMLRTSTRNLSPPGGPEDLQSPGEGCGSGEKVYKKPRQTGRSPAELQLLGCLPWGLGSALTDCGTTAHPLLSCWPQWVTAVAPRMP